MNDRQRLRDTYTGYAIGCAIVWALIWVIAAKTAKKETLDKLRVTFRGWVVGWTRQRSPGAYIRRRTLAVTFTRQLASSR
jgi:hypothetical protein